MRAPLFCVLLAALTAGCVATQKDILDLSQQTDGMTLQIHQLKKVMSSLQANQADLNERLAEMHRGMDALGSNLSENKEAMSTLSAKIDDLGSALGHKFSNLDTSIQKTRDLIKDREDRDAAERERSKQEEAARRAAEEERRKQEESKRAEEEKRKAEGPTPSQIYHKARVQLSQKQYDMAAEGFKLYINDYPNGEVADLAAYYLGQVRYAQGQWELAARNFALVLDRHPKSDVTPAARLRYALALMKMKTHLEEAKRYLESIPQDFPRAPEAQKAKELLHSWEKNAEKEAGEPKDAPADKKAQ